MLFYFEGSSGHSRTLRFSSFQSRLVQEIPRLVEMRLEEEIDEAELFYGHMSHFWKDVAIAGGMAMIVANGPGLFSMEAHAEKKTPVS